MLEGKEVEITFAHVHNGVCSITSRFRDGHYLCEYRLHVPIDRLKSSLEYLGEEIGRDFVVLGDEDDVDQAKRAPHAK